MRSQCYHSMGASLRECSTTWSPLRPDGLYQLDLSRRDERQLAKMLLHLTLAEPGENNAAPQFRARRGDPPLPDFDLRSIAAHWSTEPGFPRHGLLRLVFYSGEGEGHKGCEPSWVVRVALCANTLSDAPVPLPELGEKANLKQLMGYLSPSSFVGSSLLKFRLNWNYHGTVAAEAMEI